MKKILILSTILFTYAAHGAIYTNTGNFRPYVGIDAGLNIADYTYTTDLDETYYSATINAGARIGNNFGVELFFSHSSTNDLEYTQYLSAINHELYYMAFGFDIYGYYNISRELNFFTTFGVANYKTYNKFEIIESLNTTETKESDNDVSTRIGIGLIYTFPSDGISILLKYQYTPLNNELIQTMSEFSAGFRYNF
ncbi:MAG: outer membrane beta-barrel protein [Alphaproteobacteria bacterium]|nr:outer membrane beta-barrel protein [Alphaproteobacteria bacterium]